MSATRLEIDSIGQTALPADALYGAGAARGRDNFDISFRKLGDVPELVRALARIKRAAALANREIGALPAELADAIAAAANEVEQGRHNAHFVVDLLEGSGGTSTNMNVNEVIANRALQLLGDVPGNYARLHPNDHVNLGQSTNDVVPSAIKLAVHEKAVGLIAALQRLAAALHDRADRFHDALHLGRTCLQPAQPMLMGQTFGGYASAINRVVAKLAGVRDDLLTLPLGGTAIGTGLGAAPGYRAAVYRHLAGIHGADVQPGGDMFDAMQNADGFARFSAELRIGAEILGKIAADLVILSSGLGGAVGELELPSVQPGSSIMPGKINPVLPMMMQQVAFAVVGNDAAISLAALHGQLEINHFEPIIASRLFDSIDLLERSVGIFTDKCIAGIEVNREESLRILMHSPALATVFVPRLGYAAVSSLVRASAAERRPFIDLAIERGLVDQSEVLAVLHQSTGTNEGTR